MKSIFIVFFLISQIAVGQVVDLYALTKDKHITPYKIKKFNSEYDYQNDVYKENKVYGSNIYFDTKDKISVRFGNEKIKTYFLVNKFTPVNESSSREYDYAMLADAKDSKGNKYQIMFIREPIFKRGRGYMMLINSLSKKIDLIFYRIESELTLND